MEKKYFQFEVSPIWSLISEVKQKIYNLMNEQSKGITDFTVMTASELMENAIKYGIANEQIPNVGIEFSMDNKIICNQLG